MVLQILASLEFHKEWLHNYSQFLQLHKIHITVKAGDIDDLDVDGDEDDDDDGSESGGSNDGEQADILDQEDINQVKLRVLIGFKQ